MKAENPYLKILKERYLSLIVAPIVIVGGIFYYFHIAGISFTSEYEIVTIFPLFGIPIFVFIQALIALRHFLHKNFSEAFGLLIRLLIVVFIAAGYKHYYIPDFTQKIENFAKEKQYYLRQVDIRRSEGRDRKEKLITFDFFSGKGTYSCCVVYDESDTLLDPANDHRELGAFQTIHANYREKIGQVPIEVIKIEPYFYYVCRDYKNKFMFKNNQKENK